MALEDSQIGIGFLCEAEQICLLSIIIKIMCYSGVKVRVGLLAVHYKRIKIFKLRISQLCVMQNRCIPSIHHNSSTSPPCSEEREGKGDQHEHKHAACCNMSYKVLCLEKSCVFCQSL
jgi:hypothetical protein